jgi:hypothetical protein
MAAGDVIVIGPYNPDAAGMALLDTALTALTHTDSASDTLMIVPMINNAGVFVVNVEGA